MRMNDSYKMRVDDRRWPIRNVSDCIVSLLKPGRSVSKHLPLEKKFVDYTHYCESSISLESGRSKDRLRLCRLFTSFQECPQLEIVLRSKR